MRAPLIQDSWVPYWVKWKLLVVQQGDLIIRNPVAGSHRLDPLSGSRFTASVNPYWTVLGQDTETHPATRVPQIATLREDPSRKMHACVSKGYMQGSRLLITLAVIWWLSALEKGGGSVLAWGLIIATVQQVFKAVKCNVPLMWKSLVKEYAMRGTVGLEVCRAIIIFCPFSAKEFANSCSQHLSYYPSKKAVYLCPTKMTFPLFDEFKELKLTVWQPSEILNTAISHTFLCRLSK